MPWSGRCGGRDEGGGEGAGWVSLRAAEYEVWVVMYICRNVWTDMSRGKQKEKKKGEKKEGGIHTHTIYTHRDTHT